MKTVLRIIVSALLLMLVSQALWSLSGFAFMSLYTDAQYIATWTKIALPTPHGPSSEMLIATFAINFVAGVLFTLAYRFLRDRLKGNMAQKGLTFAGILFIVGVLPGFAMSAVMIHLSPEMYMTWIGTSLLVYTLNGLVVAKVNKV